MSVWPVCIDNTKDQQYFDVCLTCMYWLFEKSTVPWCLFDLYVLAIRKINSTLMSVWPVCIGYTSTVPWCLFDLYVLAIRKINSTLMSVWPVCIGYTKDQQYLDVCLTCMYWLYVRSTVPWCLFDLYVLTIRKINSTLMSVWPVCIDYTKDQQYLDVCLTCMYWLYARSTVPWCLFDYTKDQLYLGVCLTCMYWLCVRSTVPWCLLTTRKINNTLMSVWPVCIGYR